MKQLLADIEAGLIDCVVVYKVDRLSRSLLDFARLMSVFERRNVSFVSVTQDFNTTTSLGRLTLNILLSFAQFEREIISERTRDKLGAARRKGKWIGGIPVLGYDVDPAGGRLIVNPEEARSVQAIFAIAAQSPSLAATLREITVRGYTTKHWISGCGREHPGRPFGMSNLAFLLRNVLYTGDITHKGVRYRGEHPAIVEPELWERVNRQMALRAANQRGRRHAKNQASLRDLVECGQCGAKLVATYTSKRAHRYPYYVCPVAQQRKCEQRAISATELEVRVAAHMQSLFPGAIASFGIEALERLYYDSRTREVTMALRDGTRSSFRIETGRQDRGSDGVGRGCVRIPRISRVMALALKLERLVSEGRVASYAVLAEAGDVSRARMSQLQLLTNLAPAIQERLLFLPKHAGGPERITEKRLRPIAQHIDWSQQSKLFEALLRDIAAAPLH